MATVVVTLKIMPVSPDTELKFIENKASEEISKFGGKVGKVEVVPIAFGLKAINLIFVMDESKGATDSLEESVAGIEGVNSVET